MTNRTNQESAAAVGLEVMRLEPSAPPADACRRLARAVVDVGRRAGVGDRLLRVEAPLSSAVDPLRWLRAIGHPARFYWGPRGDGPMIAGGGIAEEVTGDGFEAIAGGLLGTGDDAGSVACLLTARFDLGGEQEDVWRPFGRVTLRLPLLELRAWQDRALLAVNVRPGHAGEDGAEDPIATAASTLERAAAAFEANVTSMPEPTRLEVEADAETIHAWARNVEELTAAIEAGRLRKAVLARAARLPVRARPLDLLAHLVEERPAAFRFLVEPRSGSGSAFIGATPELLYRRRGRAIESEALAGTRPRGADRDEDERLGRELRASAKDAEEQALVHEHIVAGLRPLCERLEADEEPRLLKLAGVQHLRTCLRGRLRDGASDALVLAALHPTPAVCGSPRDEALSMVRRLEGFDRGLYGGVVGLVSGHESELAVAIRSALVLDEEVRLFAGSGIVSGSHADAEWAETELKLLAVAALLGASHAGAA